jgi:acyl-homoserine lactone acylase PvdQ
VREKTLRAFAVGLVLGISTVTVMWGLLFYRPLPTIDGHFRLLGLDERAEILRDVLGTAHVYAADRHDLYFLQGYVTAQDRLAQMDLLRDAARLRSGTLAQRAADRAPRQLRDALDAYAEGVTKLIDQYTAARALPGEVVLAGRRLAPWTAADSLAIASEFLERIEPASVCASAPAVHTPKGMPVVAADLYLRLPDPGWYAVALDAGDTRAIGASLPGVPGIVAGHNGWVAWAILSSARAGTDPNATLGGLLEAMTSRTAASFGASLRGSAVAACIADIEGHEGGSDRGGLSFVPADRAAVLGGIGGRGAALVNELEQARGVDVETMRVLLGGVRPAIAGVRLIVDLAQVDTSKISLSQGISGQRASSHFRDEAPIWEIGEVRALLFSRPALSRVEGDLVFRPR